MKKQKTVNDRRRYEGTSDGRARDTWRYRRRRDGKKKKALRSTWNNDRTERNGRTCERTTSATAQRRTEKERRPTVVGARRRNAKLCALRAAEDEQNRLPLQVPECRRDRATARHGGPRRRRPAADGRISPTRCLVGGRRYSAGTGRDGYYRAAASAAKVPGPFYEAEAATALTPVFPNIRVARDPKRKRPWRFFRRQLTKIQLKTLAVFNVNLKMSAYT